MKRPTRIRERRRLLAGALAAGMALAACVTASLTAAESRAAIPATHIVFAANVLPRWNGEIYRVTGNGRRIDLSRSPSADVAPAMSPDGHWLAFVSDRGGEWAVYVVAADGRGLHRISSPLLPLDPSEDPQPQVEWAPDSRTLAVELQQQSRGVLYTGGRNGGLHEIAHNATGALAWSPDGQFLAYATNLSSVTVMNAAGRKLWWAAGTLGQNPWSATDRLAVAANSYTVAVYDRDGHSLGSFAGQYPAWSPAGALLASFSGDALQLRHDGVGRPLLRWPARPGPLAWVSGTKLRFSGANGWVGLHDWNHTRNERQGAANIATQALLTLAAAGFYLANDRQSR